MRACTSKKTQGNSVHTFTIPLYLFLIGIAAFQSVDEEGEGNLDMNTLGDLLDQMGIRLTDQVILINNPFYHRADNDVRFSFPALK